MLGAATPKVLVVILRLLFKSVCLKYIGFVNYVLSCVYDLLVGQGFLTVGRVGGGPLGDGWLVGVHEGVGVYLEVAMQCLVWAGVGKRLG